MTQETTWESNKNTINITNKSQEVSPFSAGDHNAAKQALGPSSESCFVMSCLKQIYF